MVCGGGCLSMPMSLSWSNSSSPSPSSPPSSLLLSLSAPSVFLMVTCGGGQRQSYRVTVFPVHSFQRHGMPLPVSSLSIRPAVWCHGAMCLSVIYNPTHTHTHTYLLRLFQMATRLHVYTRLHVTNRVCPRVVILVVLQELQCNYKAKSPAPTSCEMAPQHSAG